MKNRGREIERGKQRVCARIVEGGRQRREDICRDREKEIRREGERKYTDIQKWGQRNLDTDKERNKRDKEEKVQ